MEAKIFADCAYELTPFFIRERILYAFVPWFTAR